jgi:hypothetical protein
MIVWVLIYQFYHGHGGETEVVIDNISSQEGCHKVADAIYRKVDGVTKDVDDDWSHRAVCISVDKAMSPVNIQLGSDAKTIQIPQTVILPAVPPPVRVAPAIDLSKR